jgi:hypothetical protein
VDFHRNPAAPPALAHPHFDAVAVILDIEIGARGVLQLSWDRSVELGRPLRTIFCGGKLAASLPVPGFVSY